MHSQHRHHDRRGLSLIELVVAISIILLLALAVFWVGSKVRALVLALDPNSGKQVEARNDTPEVKPTDKPDQQTPDDKKETPPK